MEVKKVFLKDYYHNLSYNPYIEITTIFPIIGKLKKRIMVVIPGGGYDVVSTREGDPICLEFLKRGYISCKLVYSTDSINHSITYPNQVLELMAAIDYLKNNYPLYSISLCGFSAGGHLAGSFAYLNNYKALLAILGINNDLRVDALVLAYPVVSMVESWEEATRSVVTGNNSDLFDLLSIEKHVDKNYPPTYVWTTKDDDLVSSNNTIMLDKALTKYDVKHKTHIFDSGVHGLALATPLTVPFGVDDYDKEISSWIDEASNFLDEVLE